MRMNGVTIPAGRSLEVRRVDLKGLHGMHPLTCPKGAEIVALEVQGQSIGLTLLCDPTQHELETRTLHFLPVNHGAKTPVLPCGLSLVATFELNPGCPPVLVFEELNDQPTARSAAA